MTLQKKRTELNNAIKSYDQISYLSSYLNIILSAISEISPNTLKQKIADITNSSKYSMFGATDIASIAEQYSEAIEQLYKDRWINNNVNQEPNLFWTESDNIKYKAYMEELIDLLLLLNKEDCTSNIDYDGLYTKICNSTNKLQTLKELLFTNKTIVGNNIADIEYIYDKLWDIVDNIYNLSPDQVHTELSSLLTGNKKVIATSSSIVKRLEVYLEIIALLFF